VTEPDWKVAPGSRPRLTFDAFCETHERAWAGFARARRLTKQEAERAVTLMREHLWETWDMALGEPIPASYAWSLLKEAMAVVTAERVAISVFQPRVIERTWSEAVRAAADKMAFGMVTWGQQLGVYEAVLSLPERQRDVVILKYCLDLPDERIAEYLNSTQGTVRTIVRQARARLDAKLRRRSGQ
jgi:DNA-directed RNA polymerase specialized sigma24 family protein